MKIRQMLRKAAVAGILIATIAGTVFVTSYSDVIAPDSGVVMADTDGQGFATAFVERMYTIVLERKSDPSGLMAWSNKLISNEITGADVAAGFFDSPEFINKNLSNEEYVDILYRAILGREADEAGRAAWVKQLENYTTRDCVLDGFIRSNEFNSICSSYNVIAGSMNLTRAVDKHPAINRFVAKIYQNFLGRNPDEAGLESWVGVLGSGQIKASEFLEGVLYSNEFAAKDSSVDEFIAVLYRGILGREASAAEINAWANSGNSKAMILRGIAQSDEFSRMCADAGVERGSIEMSTPAERTSLGSEFATKNYPLILSRDIDSSSLESWTAQIVSGATASDFYNTLFTSSEFNNRNLNDSEYITAVYQAMLGRNPSANDVTNWTKAFNDSMVSRRFILIALSQSEEFASKCEKFGIEKGEINAEENRDLNTGINDFVISTYLANRNTKPTVSVLNAWVGDLINMSATGKDLVKAFCGGTNLNALSNRDKVTKIFQTALLRNPSASEINNYSSLIQNQGVDNVIDQITSSDEFRRRCDNAHVSSVLTLGWNTSVLGRVYFDGSNVLSGWQRIDGQRYYFDPANGNAAVSGWKFIDGLKYYFNPDNNTLVQNVDELIGMQSSYYITVNCTTNTIMIYTQSTPGGEYNLPVRAITCSTGKSATPTIHGDFTARRQSRWGILEGPCWGQYTTQISGNYLFHSAWYYEDGNNRSLSVREYNHLGENASHGCVRLSVIDAKWIYEHCNGSRVHIFDSPDAAPFDKPPTVQAVVISGDRGYDPTDPSL